MATGIPQNRTRKVNRSPERATITRHRVDQLRPLGPLLVPLNSAPTGAGPTPAAVRTHSGLHRPMDATSATRS